MTDIGHNSFDNTKLREQFDALVNLETQKRDTAENIKEQLEVAKSIGFDPSALREMVKAHFIMLDAKKKAKAEAKAEIAAVYANALQLELF
jgi:uncharacterized protein (UPF0335 family)